MRHQSPAIETFMTRSPHTIGEDIGIRKAEEIMQSYRIRHLPVQNGGKLVGIISDRDVRIATMFRGPGELRVGDVMMPDPYAVRMDAPLGEVVETMAEHKYGCAIVRDAQDKVVGIFTEIDALRLLGARLRK